MPMYKISILGLYQYNDRLFDKLTFPPISNPTDTPLAFTQPDKETLIALILEKSADFPALYPDWDFMNYMIGVWAKNCSYMMEKLWIQQFFRYNPIHNYDRKGTVTRTTNASSGGTVVGAQTAFNSDAFKDTGKSTTQDSAQGTETVTENLSGNIGVMSTQEMLTRERDIAMFKWYDIMSDDFINKFCVQIY